MKILFNKPYGVVCQFSKHDNHKTLKDYIPIPNVYSAGRLDTDSEGLIILTDDGLFQHQISDPKYKMQKTYWAQVEGIPKESDLEVLRGGIDLGNFETLSADVKIIDEPKTLWERVPPIRERKMIPTTWLEIKISEGKNRQVRRMTGKIGYPTLRLIRFAIGSYKLDGLDLGAYKIIYE
ncbi:MAG: pseudouridine synthase [Candidatus Methylopumilus sp.]|nr:pseudouridine synthase [Candidatus Methylopumilus sp.]